MTNLYLSIFVAIGMALFLPDVTHAQESFVVKGDSVKFFGQPGGKGPFSIIKEGEVVSVITQTQDDFWFVRYYGSAGYIHASLLAEPEMVEGYKEWLKMSTETGLMPDCASYKAVYGDSIDNELFIAVLGEADALIKLIDNSNRCIRTCYVQADSQYSIENIPEGIYTVKIAYGKDLRRLSDKDKCSYRFILNPSYRLGTETFDFNILRKKEKTSAGLIYESLEIPSYSLYLEVTYKPDDSENFNSLQISEDEFNK